MATSIDQAFITSYEAKVHEVVQRQDHPLVIEQEKPTLQARSEGPL